MSREFWHWLDRAAKRATASFAPPFPPLNDAVRRDLDNARAIGVQSTADLEALAINPDVDWEVRVSCCRLLGYLGDGRSAPTLAAALRDPHPRLRQAALSALAQVWGHRELRSMREVLLDDPDVDVRRRAVTGLITFVVKGNREALGALLSGLESAHSPPEMRAEVAKWLAFLPVTRKTQFVAGACREPLIVGLRDSDPRLRYWSMRALGKWWKHGSSAQNTDDILRALERTLREEDTILPTFGSIHLAAQTAIAAITGRTMSENGL